ncbi:nuclear transport factor 2 family protein [Microlunatus ginsengisoli]|uniref:SnoaL-like domain-containing protein n=1 Tax=Microlunatus ginsengisoli TaxID=363863 RepID=A0ABP7AYW3_9ACTN
MRDSQPQHSALELLQRGLQALAASDWDALRSLCDDRIVWRLPGRSPIAGELVGPDAVIARFQEMRRVTAADTPATLVALLDGGDYAAVVQRNHITGGGQSAQPVTAVTLAEAKNGRLIELHYLVSDQYAVDDLWSRML